MIEMGYKVTNGPAFSPFGERMYHNDSARRITYVFDVDDQGNTTDRRVFRHLRENQGYPDGMTVAPKPACGLHSGTAGAFGVIRRPANAWRRSKSR